MPPHAPESDLPGLDARLTLLERIYRYHDQLTHREEWACQRGCNPCCTCNVSLTTLEGIYLYRALSPLAPRLVARLTARSQNPHYQPAISLNDFAWRCARGQPTPEEANDPQWGQCPLLAEDLCSAYARRPFGCRCMLSHRRCDRHGHAALGDFELTLNHLFLQVIEHLDSRGRTANLTDMLLYLHHLDALKGESAIPSETEPAFPRNQPARVLMIPPEHRRQAAPVLENLNRIMTSFQE